jgi:hypothetical protein
MTPFVTTLTWMNNPVTAYVVLGIGNLLGGVTKVGKVLLLLHCRSANSSRSTAILLDMG